MSPSIAVKLMIYWVSQFWNVFLWFRNAWGLGYNKSKHEKAIVEIAPMHQRWVNSRRTYSGKLKNSYNSSNKIMTIVYCGNVTNDSNFGLLSISTLSSFFVCWINIVDQNFHWTFWQSLSLATLWSWSWKIAV